MQYKSPLHTLNKMCHCGHSPLASGWLPAVASQAATVAVGCTCSQSYQRPK